MGRTTVLLGGARSGKSTRALALARRAGRVTYVATAEPVDEEMRARIERHLKERPDHWDTVESGLDLPAVVAQAAERADMILIDCVTIYVARLLEAAWAEDEITGQMEALLDVCESSRADVVIVTNEVGLGLVPQTPIGRTYRDVLGRVNQLLAQRADEVEMMVAGLTWRLKG